MKTKKITDFKDRPMISYLSYNRKNHSLYFDITKHHFRDIYQYDLQNEELMKAYDNNLYDERNYSSDNSGNVVFSKDQSGIYNLYYKSNSSKNGYYITNVTGGAFMPDISNNGRILFSLYENGKYKISLLDNVSIIDEKNVGYAEDYYRNNSNLSKSITKLDSTNSHIYKDQFPNMFIMPKIMGDYGTIKPGFYFYSNEIINRLSLFGGASVNQLKDMDLYFVFDFKRLYPTIFFETYYLTRHTTDNSKYKNIYDVQDDIKFRLVQFRPGLKIPIYGTSLEFSTTFQWYRAFIQEEVNTNEYGTIQAGAAYDYFKGNSFNLSWGLNVIKNTLNKTIQPSHGFLSNNVRF